MHYLDRIDARMAEVDTSDPDACHEWPGATASGYGHVGRGGRGSGNISVPVAVLQRALGRDLLPGEVARHTCDNPPCCNPRHLLAGTKADNSRDMVLRGRSTQGTRAPLARLTDDAVRAIRRDRRPQGQIAAAYGISQALVSMIRSRHRWGHVEDGDAAHDLDTRAVAVLGV